MVHFICIYTCIYNIYSTPFSYCTAAHCEFLLRGINKGLSIYLAIYLITNPSYICYYSCYILQSHVIRLHLSFFDSAYLFYKKNDIISIIFLYISLQPHYAGPLEQCSVAMPGTAAVLAGCGLHSERPRADNPVHSNTSGEQECVSAKIIRISIKGS